MEKTVVMIDQSNAHPRWFWVKISKEIFKRADGQSLNIIIAKKQRDLSVLAPGPGLDLAKSILQSLIHCPGFSWVCIDSPSQFTVCLRRITPKAKDKVIEALSHTFGEDKTAHAIKERIVFSH